MSDEDRREHLKQYRRKYYQEHPEKYIPTQKYCNYCLCSYTNTSNHLASQRHKHNVTLGIPTEEEITMIKEFEEVCKRRMELSKQINRLL
jgi:hypothetical protein